MMRNETYFENRRVAELVKFALTDFSIEPLRGFIHELDDVYESYARNLNLVCAFAGSAPYLALAAVASGQRFTKAVHEETGASRWRSPLDARIVELFDAHVCLGK